VLKSFRSFDDERKSLKNFPLDIYNYIFAVKGHYWV